LILDLGLRYRPTNPEALDAHRDRLALLTLDLADIPAPALEAAIDQWVMTKPFLPKASELAELARASIEASRPIGTLAEQCEARNAMLDEAGNERLRWRITGDGQWLAVDYDEWCREVGRQPPPRRRPDLPPPLTDEVFDRIVADRGVVLSACLDRGTIISNGDGTFRRPDFDGS
jgi:hypothetical protein